MKNTELKLVRAPEEKSEREYRENHGAILRFDDREYRGEGGSISFTDGKKSRRDVKVRMPKLSGDDEYRLNHYAKVRFDGKVYEGIAGRFNCVSDEIEKLAGRLSGKPIEVPTHDNYSVFGIEDYVYVYVDNKIFTEARLGDDNSFENAYDNIFIAFINGKISEDGKRILKKKLDMFKDNYECGSRSA